MGSTVASQSFGAIYPSSLASREQLIAQLCLLSSYTVTSGSNFALLRVVFATTRLCNGIDTHKNGAFCFMLAKHTVHGPIRT